MGEETLVQAAQVLPDAGAHHQAGTAAPEHRSGLVVLADVFLHLLEDASPAEGIAVAVYHSARRAGILESIPLIIREKLGTAGAAAGMAVHPLDERAQPAPGDFYVAVDEDVIIGLHFLQGAVVAARKAVVLVEADQRHLGEFLLHQFAGAVAGVVVGHIDAGIEPFARGQQARQELPEIVPGVVIQYDDRRFHYALKSTSVKARVGTSLLRQGRASSAAAARWLQRERKLPVMSISRTGCTRFPSLITKPSMP